MTTTTTDRRLRANEHKLIAIDGDKFSVFERTTLTTFASDLTPIAVWDLWWLQQIYNDACDIGIAIHSERTGVCVRFRLVEEQTGDGDLQAWHFEPLDKREAVRACGIKRVTIFND